MKTEQIRPRESSQMAGPHEARLAKLPCDVCAGRSLGICSPLGDSRLRQLLQLGGQRRWTRREYLYRADEPLRAFYKITKGIVIESRPMEDGRRQVVGIRAIGDLCGHPHNGRYLFSAEALTEVEACAFNSEKFAAFTGRHIDVACALVEDVSEKLRRATESMTVMGQLTSNERLAHFLMEMSELQAARQCSVQPLTLHLTRQEIADYLGLTLETVSRSFSKMRDMRVLALVGKDAVEILDAKRLCKLARR